MYQWFPPTGGKVFCGMAGLASVAQAALELGSWDAVLFEKDAKIFEYAQKAITDHINILDKKMKHLEYTARQKSEVALALVAYRRQGLSGLSQDQVHLYEICYIPRIFRKL